MERRWVRVVVSAIAAGGVSFGATVAASLADGGTITESTFYIVIAGVVGAMAKDIQSSLSTPPGKQE